MTALDNELARLLKLPSFVSFYVARLFTVSGYQMLCVAIAWHLYDLTGSALDLGLIGLVQFLPRVLFVLPAGEWPIALTGGVSQRSCRDCRGWQHL